MASEAYPLLDELLSGHAKLRADILQEDRYGGRMPRYEKLLERARELGVTGVEKLATNGSNPHKFENLMAELLFAVLFARLGARVTLLRDEAFGPGAYAPDLDVSFENGPKFFVDAIRFSSGSPEFAEALHELAQRTSWRLGYRLGLQLSASARRRPERAAIEARIKDVADEVGRALRAAKDRGVDAGMLHVFAEGTLSLHRFGGQPVMDYAPGRSANETSKLSPPTPLNWTLRLSYRKARHCLLPGLPRVMSVTTYFHQPPRFRCTRLRARRCSRTSWTAMMSKWSRISAM